MKIEYALFVIIQLITRVNFKVRWKVNPVYSQLKE